MSEVLKFDFLLAQKILKIIGNGEVVDVDCIVDQLNFSRDKVMVVVDKLTALRRIKIKKNDMSDGFSMTLIQKPDKSPKEEDLPEYLFPKE